MLTIPATIVIYKQIASMGGIPVHFATGLENCGGAASVIHGTTQQAVICLDGEFLDFMLTNPKDAMVAMLHEFGHIQNGDLAKLSDKTGIVYNLAAEKKADAVAVAFLGVGAVTATLTKAYNRVKNNIKQAGMPRWVMAVALLEVQLLCWLRLRALGKVKVSNVINLDDAPVFIWVGSFVEGLHQKGFSLPSIE